jgi:hypothetical protein
VRELVSSDPLCGGVTCLCIADGTVGADRRLQQSDRPRRRPIWLPVTTRKLWLGSQKAIQIDTSRWEAYLVGGSALENQKQFDLAIENYTKALDRAPEPKKDAVRGLLEQCKKLSAASSSAVSTPATTAQGPNFKETLDWLISKNAQGGFAYDVGYPAYSPDAHGSARYHTDFNSDSAGAQCTAALQGGAEVGSGPQLGAKIPSDGVGVCRQHGLN